MFKTHQRRKMRRTKAKAVTTLCIVALSALASSATFKWTPNATSAARTPRESISNIVPRTALHYRHRPFSTMSRIAHTQRQRRIAIKVNFQIVLRSRDPGGLESIVRQTSTPGSHEYLHFLSAQRFAADFGASPLIIGHVERVLERAHITPSSLWRNRLVIAAVGSTQALGRLFKISFFRVRVGSRGFFEEATRLPTIPLTLRSSVVGTMGLFPNGSTPLTQGRQARASAKRTAALVRLHSLTVRVSSPLAACRSAQAQAQSLGSYLPAQIARLYGLTALYVKGGSGRGVTIALPEFTSPTATRGSSAFQRDLARFQRCFHASGAVTFTKVQGGSGNTSSVNLEEAALDAETLSALSPRARLDIYSATQGNSDEMYFQMVNDDRAALIVSSWGSCEQLTASIDVHVERLALLEAAAQGQSFIAAAGDDGSEDCWSSHQQSELAIDDPGSQPYATDVGGVQYNSTLSLSSTIAPRVWNDPSYSGGSGGGTSILWNRPSYQSPVATVDPEAVSSCSRPGKSCRLAPDISMLAEGFLIDTPTYGWDVLGGTSGSAPVFGAGIADLESLVHHRLGLLNPLLYTLGSTHPQVFTDVTLGSNDYHHRHHGLFHARLGYDVASGLGTVNFATLLRYLPHSLGGR